MAKRQPNKVQPKNIQDKPTSGHSDKETVSFAWCDGGTVEGRFTSGLLNTLLEAQRRGIKDSQESHLCETVKQVCQHFQQL